MRGAGRRPVAGASSTDGQKVLKFNSPSYLGFRHSSDSLEGWADLIDEGSHETQRSTADAVAALQGCEAAITSTSTLHLFHDFFGQLDGERLEVYAEESLYPVARWGVERAAGQGVVVRKFRHLDADDLNKQLKLTKRQPLIVANGLCTGCGEPSPVSSYLQCADQYGGRLLLDDTQALGILGDNPSTAAPYGRGGGGVLRWAGLETAEVTVISSLAKGFGAPLAVLSGPRDDVAQFAARSETIRYCTPPSSAALNAVRCALTLNHEHGDRIRGRLVTLVRRFKDRVASIGLSVSGGIFPVQTLGPIRGQGVGHLHKCLRRLGVEPALVSDATNGLQRIVFCITASHEFEEIDEAVAQLQSAIDMAG